MQMSLFALLSSALSVCNHMCSPSLFVVVFCCFITQLLQIVQFLIA